MNAGPSLFGRSMPRIEDVPLLRGAARFVDDIELPGLLHVALLRSPVAHARLRAIDAAKARAVAGVHAVFTYADLRPLLTGDRIPLAMPSAAIRFHVDPFPLVHEEICYVGEPIALVVAETRAIAEDAAALIEHRHRAAAARSSIRARVSRRARRGRGSIVPDNLVARHADQIRRR